MLVKAHLCAYLYSSPRLLEAQYCRRNCGCLNLVEEVSHGLNDVCYCSLFLSWCDLTFLRSCFSIMSHSTARLMTDLSVVKHILTVALLCFPFSISARQRSTTAAVISFNCIGSRVGRFFLRFFSSCSPDFGYWAQYQDENCNSGKASSVVSFDLLSCALSSFFCSCGSTPWTDDALAEFTVREVDNAIANILSFNLNSFINNPLEECKFVVVKWKLNCFNSKTILKYRFLGNNLTDTEIAWIIVS